MNLITVIIKQFKIEKVRKSSNGWGPGINASEGKDSVKQNDLYSVYEVVEYEKKQIPNIE